MTRYRIIVNPSSNRGAVKALIPAVEAELQKHGLEYDLSLTEYAWHAASLAQQAVVLGYDVVVAVGGDGTFNEVLNGLMLACEASLGEAAVAVLPVGQGNDFAFGVGIPLQLEQSCRVLAEDHRRRIDIGQVSGGHYPLGRYFGNGIGIGFDAVASFFHTQNKKLHGFLSYLLAVLKTIQFYAKAPMLEVTWNEHRLVQPCLMVSAMNGKRLAGGFLVAPHPQAAAKVFEGHAGQRQGPQDCKGTAGCCEGAGRQLACAC